MSIRTRLILGFMAVIVITGVSAIMIGRTLSKDALKDEIRNHLMTSVQSKASEIESAMAGYGSYAEYVAREITASYTYEAEHGEAMPGTEERLASFIATGQFEDHYLVIDRDGVAYVSFGRYGESNQTGWDHFDMSTHEAFLKAKEGTCVMDTRIDELTQDIVVATATPFYAGDDFDGVYVLLGGENLLSEVTADTTGLGETGEVFIINQEGEVITPSRFVEGEALDLKADLEHMVASTAETGAAGSVAPPIDVVSFKNYAGRKVICAHTHLPQTGWTVAAQVSTSEAFAPVGRLTNWLLAVLIGVFVLGTGMAVLISRVTTRPILRLHRGAEEIMQGNLDCRVGTTGRDEISQLSRAFDMMAAGLKKSRMELEAYAEALEVRVKERTNELTNTVGQLRQEVNDRKRAEEALRESEEKYRTIIEGLQEVIFKISLPEVRYDYVSPAAEVVTGYTAEEFMDTPMLITQIIHPDFTAYFEEKYAELLRGEVSPVYEFKIIDPEGNERWLLQSNKGVYDESGTVVALECICRNITESKVTDEALRESETRYRLLAENVRDVIWTGDMHLRTTYISPSVTDQLGYTVEEAMARTLEEALTPPSLGVVNQLLAGELAMEQAEAKDLSRSRTLELEAYRKDGSTIWTEARLTFLRDEVGQPIGIIGVNRDITKRKLAEEALRESEAGLKQAQQVAHVGSWEWNIVDDSYYLSEEMLRIYGLGDEMQATSMQFLLNEMVHPEDSEPVRQAADEIASSGDGRGTVFRIVQRSGEVRWIEAAPPEVKRSTEDGSPLVIVGTVQDVTERKEAEDALRESEEKYRLIAETATEGIYQVDESGNFVFVNQAYADILGYTREELLGNHFTIIIPETSIPDALQVVDGVMAGTPAKGDFVLKHKLGHGIPVHFGMAPLMKQEASAGFMGIIEDITERKEAEEALRSEKEKFRALTEESPLGVSIIDRDGSYKYINPRFVEMFGYTLEDVPTGREWFRKAYPDRDYTHQAIRRWIEELKKNDIGESRPIEFTVKCKDGSEKVICFLPVSLESREQFVTYEDVTERRRAEEEIARARELEEIDRLRTDFLANISHELRTPLAAIKGFATSLLRTDTEWDEETRQEFLNTISQESDRLTGMIGELLQMTWMESGQMGFYMTGASVSEIIDLVMDRLESLTQSHGLQLAIPSNLSLVTADKERIGQVITNLVENATIHSPQGTPITVEAELSDDKVVISVSDEGAGIPPEHLKRVFDRFFQVERKARGSRGGTGLGLAICRGIVEAHQGTIWVESEAGRGSKFSFSLPMFGIAAE